MVMRRERRGMNLAQVERPAKPLVPVAGGQGQVTSGGSDMRIASTFPPVFRPNWVPRS